MPELQCRGLSLDILWKAKRIAALGYPHRAGRACPLVDILKQVMVDGAVVREIHQAFGKRLFGARAGNLRFKSIKLGLCSEVELVDQDGRALVRARILDRIVR